MPSQLGSVFIYGRLKSIGRAALSPIVVNAGGRLARHPDRADTVVVAHRALDACLAEDGALRLPFALAPGAEVLSEDGFARRLVATAPPPPAAYTMDEVGRLAGLSPGLCASLAAFDVIGGEGGLAYADLAAARQVAALLAEGVAMAAIVRSAWVLAARKVRLSQTRLVAAPWGDLVQQVDGRLARLDGQFALRLDEQAMDVDSLLVEAFDHEQAGALDMAERLYRQAAQAAPGDPLPVFNLGNVLSAQNRPAEAMIAFRQALTKDDAFAEAAFNLAHLVEQAGDTARAVALYRETIAAHPAYPQPLYNLARLLTAAGAYGEALPLWDRFIALAPADPDIAHARRSATLCRMALRMAAARRP